MKRALLVLALAACGGGADRPTIGHRGGAGEGARELVLYRDGALVRDRQLVRVENGRAIVSVALPPDVIGGQVSASVIGEGARVGSLTVPRTALAIGDRVEVPGSVTGVVRWIGGNELLIDDGAGVRLVLDPRHVIRREAGGARHHVDVEVIADRGGAWTVEVVYLTEHLRWTADYTLVMEAAAGRAELHGALGIDNATGVAFDDAVITLVDTDRPTQLTAFDDVTPRGKGPAPVLDPKKPRGEQPVKPKKLREVPTTRLPFEVDVRPGNQSVSLLAGTQQLRARQTLVYDPVGDERNLPGRQPTFDRDYGLDKKSRAVSQSIDVDLQSARIPSGLPAGPVRLLERGAGGALSPLGESRIFERAATDSDKIAPTTSVAVGRASTIEGKRVRRELTLDEDGKRLTEEFAIELTNTADHPVEVIVREHLYRGLNWILAYQSSRKVAKEGPQKIALTTTVPAKGTSTVVYRVVYHW